jgi:hypothetical protein
MNTLCLTEPARRAIERSQIVYALENLEAASLGASLSQPFARTPQENRSLQRTLLAQKARALVLHDRALTLYPRGDI